MKYFLFLGSCSYCGWATGWKIGVRLLTKQDFLLFSVSRSALGPSQPQFTGYLGFFQSVKWLGCEVDYLPTSGIEVKTDWSCTSLPIRCHGMDGVNFVIISPIWLRIPTQPHIQWLPEASKQSVKLTSTTFSAQVYNVQNYLAAK